MYGMVWYVGLNWYGVELYGMVWYGMVCHLLGSERRCPLPAGMTFITQYDNNRPTMVPFLFVMAAGIAFGPGHGPKCCDPYVPHATSPDTMPRAHVVTPDANNTLAPPNCIARRLFSPHVNL